MNRKELTALRNYILSLWEDAAFSLEGCTATDNCSAFDRPGIEGWVRGKNFSRTNIEILAASHDIEWEQPLLFVRAEALEGFLGVYMLALISDAIVDDASEITDEVLAFNLINLSSIHFARFLSTERFASVFKNLSAFKQHAVYTFVCLFIESVSREESDLQQVFGDAAAAKKFLVLPTTLLDCAKSY
jgi:hypothetical protein